jgi:hypothetical protein
MSSPEISEDEIANAAGISDMHDGVNFMRAACVIAVEKARLSFDPLLEGLRVRTVHVLKRLFAVVEHMLKREGLTMSESHQKPFSFIVRRIFENFVEVSTLLLTHATLQTTVTVCYTLMSILHSVS